MDLSIIQGLVAQSDTASQTRALQYFEHLKATEEGWKLCLTTLLSEENNADYVKFFCFQVIEHFVKQRYPNCGGAEQQILKDFLSRWIHLQTTLGTQEKSFILNKAAQVIGLMFLVDYPVRWPTFFFDIQNTLSLGHQAVDFYLRVILSINSDIADREITRTQAEHDRNTLIKDTMRELSVMELVESWYQIMTTYPTNHPELVILCLEVIGGYVAWIDINLIANERFVSVMVPFFNSPPLREAACECVHEIVNKGMDPIAKTTLVESFASVLEQAGILKSSNGFHDDDDEDFISKLAKLVNGMGSSLLISYNKLVKTGCNEADKVYAVRNAIQKKVPLLLQFLSHEDDDVSLAVCEFARDFIQFLKYQSSVGSYGAAEQGHTEAMLYIIINKYKYDGTYNFSHLGEDEAIFDEFRKAMKVLFDNLTQLDRNLVLPRVKEMIVSTFQTWRTLPFYDVEVAITFLYLLGEAIPAQHGNHFSGEGQHSEMMLQMMKMLVTCGVSTYGHVAVTLQYFETVARYERFFLQEPHHVPEVLVAFMDERGLRNSSLKIRSRTSYLFSRFIKCLKAHIQNFTEDILKRLKDLLVLASPDNGMVVTLLSSDDQLYLYEAAAVLIVSNQLENQKKQLLLRNLLTPVMAKFESLLARAKIEPNEDIRNLAIDCMSHAMAVTSRTSKAFSNQQTMKNCNCVPVYIEALTVFLQALEVAHENNNLQSSIRQFLHRMVVCLEEEILPFIPTAAEQLLKDADVRSIQEFIPLINQIIAKFKKDIVPFLHRVFMPLVTAIFSALSSPIDDNDLQAQRERQMLQRSYFLFIAAIVTNNVTEVIANQESQNMEQVVLTIIQGAVNFPDPIAQKTCFGILKKMVELWGGPENTLDGFVAFIYKSIVPACFEAPSKNTFDLTDAQTVLALSESALCLKAVYDKRGEEFIEYLQSQYLPALNMSPIQIQEYCQALKSDIKVFKKFVKAFFEKSRL